MITLLTVLTTVSASSLELECMEEARICARVSDSRDLILPDCMSRVVDTICIKEGEHNNCGSLLKTNETNHIYQNELYDLEGNTVNWRCAYSTPATVVNYNAPVGNGNFLMAFQLFSDSEYRNPLKQRSPHLPMDGLIRARVSLLDHQNLGRATVQLLQCMATPTPDPLNPSGLLLLDDFCPVESGAAVNLVDSGNGPFGIFEANVFKFAESSEVHLHCRVRICFNPNSGEKSCSINQEECRASSLRVRREGILDEPTTMISIGPIDVSDALLIDDSAEKEEIIVEIEREIGEQDGRIKIHPTVLWILVSALIVIFIAIIALFLAVLRWMKQSSSDKYSVSGSSVMLQNSPRGSLSSVETA